MPMFKGDSPATRRGASPGEICRNCGVMAAGHEEDGACPTPMLLQATLKRMLGRPDTMADRLAAAAKISRETLDDAREQAQREFKTFIAEALKQEQAKKLEPIDYSDFGTYNGINKASRDEIAARVPVGIQFRYPGKSKMMTGIAPKKPQPETPAIAGPRRYFNTD